MASITTARSRCDGHLPSRFGHAEQHRDERHQQYPCGQVATPSGSPRQHRGEQIGGGETGCVHPAAPLDDRVGDREHRHDEEEPEPVGAQEPDIPTRRTDRRRCSRSPPAGRGEKTMFASGDERHDVVEPGVIGPQLDVIDSVASERAGEMGAPVAGSSGVGRLGPVICVWGSRSCRRLRGRRSAAGRRWVARVRAGRRSRKPLRRGGGRARRSTLPNRS